MSLDRAELDAANYHDKLTRAVIEIEQLKKQLKSQHEVLKQALQLLAIVFNYEGDVFGVYHNNAVDVVAAIREILK